MNSLEKLVYDLLKRNPALKFLIRDAYQMAWDALPVKRINTDLTIHHREGYYFGFHDKCPFSPDDSKLLAGKYTIPVRSPRPNEELIIGYFDGEHHMNFNEVTRTKAWNWHQGSQLQWRGNSSEFAFNDFKDGSLITRIIDSQNGKEREAHGPIATISPDGNWGIGYNFLRVQKLMPGYGYLSDSTNNLDAIPSNDGLYRIDFNTGESKLIVQIKDICQLDVEDSMKDGKHYFSHAIIAPGGKRVMFLHRWIKNDYRLRWSRMFACDLDGQNLYKFPTHQMVSHMGWKNESQILAYCRLGNNKDGYVLFDDLGSGNYKEIASGLLTSDGHPSYENTGRFFVTDTYPNRRRHQKLIIFDEENKKLHQLGSFYHPKKYASEDLVGPLRCDLHPRWNRNGNLICFDSVFSGKRSLCTVDVSSIISPAE